MLRTAAATAISPADLFAAPDAIVPRPSLGAPNRERLLEWAQAPGEDHEIRQQLAANTRIISFPELKSALCEVVNAVNALVAHERLSPALLMGRSEWSSNHWVTNGVRSALSFEPCAAGHIREMGARANQDLIEGALAKGGDSFVVFDDAVFSGQQIELDLAQQLKMVSIYLSAEAARRLLSSKIILAPAFSTAQGREHALKSCSDFGFKNVEFVSSASPIATIGELFTPEFVETLRAWRRHSTRSPIERLSLTIFEHGCPDDESSLLEVTQHLGPIRKPYRPGFNIRML